MNTFQTTSYRQTTKIGEKLAAIILRDKIKSNKRGATIFTLQGDLGAGKTTFTQGFARGLGIKRRLISPTFVIMRRYAIPAGGKNKTSRFKNLYHIDAYRLKNPDGLETLGLKAILNDPTAIVLVEWPENLKKILPSARATGRTGAKITRIAFRHGKKENERSIIIR